MLRALVRSIHRSAVVSRVSSRPLFVATHGTTRTRSLLPHHQQLRTLQLARCTATLAILLSHTTASSTAPCHSSDSCISQPRYFSSMATEAASTSTSAAAVAATIPTPPIATPKPYKVKDPFGLERDDPYFWLREKKNPEVIEYLEAENAYTKAVMNSEAFEKKLYDEFLSRIKQTDESVPYRQGPWYYYTRTVEGQQYSIHCRKPLDSDQEYVLLDENLLAEGKEYCSVGDVEPSPDGKLLAFSVDYAGDEKHELRVKNLETGEVYADTIADVTYGVVWGNDNKTFFYITLDHALRPYRLWRHVLGTPVDQDQIVHEEPDERFFLSIGKTQDQRFILCGLGSSITSECLFIDANHPGDKFQVFLPRKHEVEYEIESHGNTWFLLTNADDAKNFKLLVAPILENHDPEQLVWRELIPHDRLVKLTTVIPFEKHIAIKQRKDGLPQIQIMNATTYESHFIQFPEPAYSCQTSNNLEFHTDVLRIRYHSFITPESTFDYNMTTRELKLLKEKEVLGGYDRTLYHSERISATAEDGTAVPISIVYKKTTPLDGSAPLLLWGYGSYGANYDAYFSVLRFSLLDRGVICAIAHIRGGGELGRYWKDDGKLLKKKNTFNDFIACGRHLQACKYTSADRMAIYGGSAGGLLIGAALNQGGAGFCKVAVASVPFVDVISTLLDKDIPLTVTEWEEWGNPYVKEEYEYMLSYSPYDNLKAQDYPNVLIKAGLNDPRVQYWEPAKFCAKLRTLKTDNSVLLMKTNMGAGHFGSSGRYDHYKEDAFEYAFLLQQLGIKE